MITISLHERCLGKQLLWYQCQHRMKCCNAAFSTAFVLHISVKVSVCACDWRNCSLAFIVRQQVDIVKLETLNVICHKKLMDMSKIVNEKHSLVSGIHDILFNSGKQFLFLSIFPWNIVTKRKMFVFFSILHF